MKEKLKKEINEEKDKTLLDEESTIENPDDDFNLTENAITLEDEEFELLKQMIEDKFKELAKTELILSSINYKVKESEKNKKPDYIVKFVKKEFYNTDK